MRCHLSAVAALSTLTSLAGSCLLGQASPAPTTSAATLPSAAKATVIFFTPGGYFRGLGDQFKHTLWGTADVASFGTIFDGDERIAKFRRARYLVVRLPAGPHTFSSSISRTKPSKKEVLALDLAPGSITYVAETTTIKNYGMSVINYATSHINQSSCKEFVEEDTKVSMEADPPGKIDKRYAALVDDAFDVRNRKP